MFTLCFTVRFPLPSILSKSNVYFEVLFLFFLGDIGVFHYLQPIVVKSRNRTELDYTAGESNISSKHRAWVFHQIAALLVVGCLVVLRSSITVKSSVDILKSCRSMEQRTIC